MTDEEISASIRALTAQIEEAGLGPVESVREIYPGGIPVILIELDSTSVRKARTALRWLDLITVQDMVAGKFCSTDAELRLSLRGHFQSDTPVILVVSFHEGRDARQVATINAQIGRQQPRELITRLADIEGAADG